MKKLLFTIIGIAFTTFVFGQGTISFYTGNGTKKVTKIKCGEFDNIKVKLNVPSYVKSYDRVSLRIYLSSIKASYASILYDGRGATAQLASTPKLEKWVLKPGKNSGEFSFGDGNLGSRDLCEYPQEQGIANVEVTAQLVGMNKAGSETYWDDFYKKYRTRIKYTKGKLIAQGKINIEQLPAKTVYISANGVMSIQKVSANPEDEFITGEKQKSSTSDFLNKLNNNDNTGSKPEKFTAQQAGRAGKVFFTAIFYTDKQIADKVNELFGQVPSDLDAYGELKRDLLQLIAKNTYPNIYRPTFFEWPEIISKTFCPTMQDENKKFKNTNTNFFTNMDLWKKVKIGNYEYDVLTINDVYGATSSYRFDNNSGKFRTKNNDDIPATMTVLAIKRGEYNIFIYAVYDDNNYNNVFLKNPNPEIAKKQKEFAEKTLKSIKFLK